MTKNERLDEIVTLIERGALAEALLLLIEFLRDEAGEQ